MNRHWQRTCLLAVLLLCSIVLPAIANADSCKGVGATCSLEDLGGGRFRFTWVVVNGSPDPTAIFKWDLGPPDIPSSWVTVSFNVPTGWIGTHPDSHLDFAVMNNGDLNPDRIFSPSVASCGSTGSSSLTFQWTFDNTGSQTPDCADFDALDYTFHYQPINAADCRNAGQTLTCPGLLPVEPVTWGRVKNIYR